MILSCFIEVFFLEIHSSCLGDNIECRYSNECNWSHYRLIVITWKYNAMNNSWLWLQNQQRQACNVFVFTFITQQFKQNDVLHIKYLVQKVFFNWDSLHSRLNSHYEGWSYKKMKHKKDYSIQERFRKNLLLKDRSKESIL